MKFAGPLPHAGIAARSLFLGLTAASLLCLPVHANPPDRVRLQLKWPHQFQFAGYYAAQEKGYYRDAGLEVEILPGDTAGDATQKVLEGRAEFGVGSTDLLLYRERGEPVVALAAIFQHSPVALMTLKRDRPQSIHDLAGRRIMIESNTSELLAYLNKEGLTPNKYTLLTQNSSVKDLVAGKADALSVYVTDEPFALTSLGQDYQIYSPRAAGIDFYGDTLFTTEGLIRSKPEMVKAFRSASLEGWKYAMEHPEELVQLIHSRYSQRHSVEHLRFEAREMVSLVQTPLIEIGHMYPGRWRHIAETYAELGMMKPDFDFGGFLYDPNPPSPDRGWLHLWMVLATVVVAIASTLALYIHRINVRLLKEAEERRQAKAALQESTAALTEAQRVAQIGNFSWDLATRTARWSAQVDRLFNLDPRTPPTDPDAQLKYFTPESAERLAAARKKAVETGEPYQLDLEVADTDGPIRWVATRAEATRDADGRITGLRGTIQDITGRKRMEQELREVNNRYNQLVRRLPVGIYTMRARTDGTLRFEYGSERFFQLLGVKEEDALRDMESVLRHVHRDDRTSLDQMNWRATQARQPFRWEGRFWSAGELIWIHVEAESTLMPNGDTLWNGVVNDITERKQLEEKLLRNQRMESIGTLAAGVAHDLNNIMTPILLSAELLRKEGDPAVRENMITHIEKSVKRGAGIISQVLTFARGTAVERTDIKMDQLIGDIAKIVRETFPRNLTLESDIPAGLWPVKGDTTQLHQVLLNLCINARDAMPEGGTLAISAGNGRIDAGFAAMTPDAKEGDYVILAVADNGEGIPEKILGKIFDPFFTTKHVGKGTGLGLSTVLGIIRSHGGFVTVKSDPDRGTLFRVYLPASGRRTEEKALPANPPAPMGKGETILVVDDEEHILTVASMLLESQGYRVLTAVDGEAALGVYRQHAGKITAVLTDVMMPRVDGVKLVRALQQLNPDVKIIGSTGQTMDDSQDELRALGVPAILRKPYDIHQLLNALHGIIHR